MEWLSKYIKDTALFWLDALASRAIEGGLLELEKDKCERARAGEHGNQETWVTGEQTNQNSNHLLAAGRLVHIGSSQM